MEGHSSVLLLSLAAAVGCWFAISVWTVLRRIAYDRREHAVDRVHLPRGPRAHGRLVRRATAHRTEHGKWRRIAALHTLTLSGEPRARRLIARGLVDADPDVVGACVRLLGLLGTDWAARELVEMLRNGKYPRSRIATQLDSLLPAVGPKLVRLLRDPEPGARFWAATLLAKCPGVGGARLLALTRDGDANVRAAAVEAVGERGDVAALAAVEERLGDEMWFVRVHALRSAVRLGGIAVAPVVAPALRDDRWWVRSAAKDALRDCGHAVAGVLIPYLEDADQFARNGAAEVLQDVGFVDGLSPYGREGELLERILSAGGSGIREAAVRRAASQLPIDSEAVSGVAS